MAAEAASTGSGANLGFEAKLFLTADKLRGSMDASEYKHVALGLVFLKYISDAFNTVYEKLKADEYADEEDAEEYLAERTFWVPKDARWSFFQNNAKQPTIGKLVDDAMLAIEKSNTRLKGVLPTNYAREALNKTMPTGRDDPIAASTISADRPRHSGEIFCVLLDYSVRKIASATMPVTRCRRHRIGK